MKIPKYNPKRPVSRIYHKLAGVDFTSDSSLVQLNRSPYSVNMYKDYKSSLGQAIETRPGYIKLLDLDNEIYGIHFFSKDKLYVIVHSGNKLYLWENYPSSCIETDMTVLFSDMSRVKSRTFIYGDKLYIMDGTNYLYYDGNKIEPVKNVAFVPTTTIGRSPSGGGTLYQPVNLLQSKRKNSFLGNGTDKNYTLDTSNLDSSSVFKMIATVDGVEKLEDIDFTVNRTTGVVMFKSAPPEPKTKGQDNVVITLSKTTSDYSKRVEGCLINTIFDNRIFYSGNNKYPNALFHSMLNDPTYISDLAYYQDGSDNVLITSLLRVGDCLLVLKSDDQQDAVVYYHTPQTKGDDVIYPTKQGLAGIGCISMWGSKNFLDEPVFISRLGLESFTKLNLGQERSIEHKSSLVDGKLVNESDLQNIHLEQWNGYLMCLINGKIYLADNRQRYQNKSTGIIEYEWYFWDGIGDIVDNKFYGANLLKEYNGELLFGTPSGAVFMFTSLKYNDDGRIIYCQWQTPSDDFGTNNHLKTTNKRGGVANLKTLPNSVCKLKENTDKTQEREIARYVARGFSFNDFSFVDLSFTTTDKSFMKYKIKEKKWTQISLTFYSDELNKPFGIYSASLEAFVGGYVKNR